MKKQYHLLAAVLLVAAFAAIYSCGKSSSKDNPAPTQPAGPDNPTTPGKSDVAMWMTTADQNQLFKLQSTTLAFGSKTDGNPTITVDETQTYQTIDGFGFALTGGSASLINSLSETNKAALLNELFKSDDKNIGISYLRISLGASDLSTAPFSYDDVAGDVALNNFSIDKERTDLIPILKKILAINPNIKILACPWSAPAWMKDNGSFYGGSLKPDYFDAYARYFVKYIQAMKAEGITIDAITPQNEPLNAYNNPSMLMLAADQAKFVGSFLGPAFRAANINTKIIVYDHNADHPEYASDIYKNTGASDFVDGAAFHLYGGNINALGMLHSQYPLKNIYFTEQATFGGGSFAGDLSWHVSNLIIGATRNWSRNVIEWNLASDPNYKPHTDGGCSTCQGAVTIGNTITRNVSYYIIAHAAKFVRPGATRIGSDLLNTLQTVAFKNTDGSKVMVVLNTANITQTFNLSYNGKSVSTSLPAGAVATYIW
ncbi:glucosylceramidase [Mucilaginibacter sp. RS28]|uniref:Glucosylceramidase n=1 Tax=Mucilaginibacter straminoryzae TaxID=2932774 RepID=A0A9X2BAL7_9SPHI|nr:glycoside hydrolase family 30 beta sandwich domain-containing protein [Mucilaginibacter straminoryzae]MCJ8212009.1 glucosylceramidase [Mucilaginibacter straminoryzae]